MPTMDGFDVARAIKRSPDLGRIALVMLTSSGSRQDPQRLRALGINEFLLKPLSGTDLLDAIIAATDPNVVTAAAKPEQAAARLVATSDRLVILVAEDHPVNQKYALRVLQKLGHEVTLANDGTEVLSLLRERVFDAILMDVQMPNLSGLEATAAIRQREAIEGGHMHIIAMTANAMVGDREACLAGGMDDYVSKPIQIERLIEALGRIPEGGRAPRALFDSKAVPVYSHRAVGRFGTSRSGPGTNGEDAGDEASASGFSREAALIKMGGDEELLKEVVLAFLEACDETVGAVEAAVHAQDARALRRAAHTLKGSVATFSTGAVYEAAFELERCGRDECIDMAPQTFQKLRGELGQMLPELRALAEVA
jgi:CheY-like chemotaxis protein/HPt (histidine-containing phosphotransfer) domain-containing protein